MTCTRSTQTIEQLTADIKGQLNSGPSRPRLIITAPHITEELQAAADSTGVTISTLCLCHDGTHQPGRHPGEIRITILTPGTSGAHHFLRLHDGVVQRTQGRTQSPASHWEDLNPCEDHIAHDLHRTCYLAAVPEGLDCDLANLLLTLNETLEVNP